MKENAPVEKNFDAGGAFARTQRLFGRQAMEKLASSHVLLFGVGGVGSYAAEALVRSGVGHLTMVDDDEVCVTNLNRQLHATVHTVGRPKADAMRERLLSINPGCEVRTVSHFYLPGDGSNLITTDYDYIIDAIDTVSAKIDIIITAQRLGVPVISCMGTGNKLHPHLLTVADIYNTSVCPLCRVMRSELRKRGVAHAKVVYSPEPPLTPIGSEAEFLPQDAEGTQRGGPRRKIPLGSTAFVPPAAGLILASEAVLDITSLQSGGKNGT